MQRTSVRRALALSATLAAVTFGGAYAIGTATVSNAAPVEDNGTPATPTLPEQAADRAEQAIAERGRDAHAQGPKDDVTTEAAPEGDDEGGEGAGPGYGPGVHAGPHGDYGPEVHPDAENHPGADDHPDADDRPDTSNHPGNQPGGQPTQ
jgi:hypothetical protein